MKTLGNVLLNTIAILAGILVCWVAISWVDVNMHNLSDQMFHPWNFFVLFF